MNSLKSLFLHSRFNKQSEFAALHLAAATELASSLSFKSKESYLTWVKEWKHAYRYIAIAARHAKVTQRLQRAQLPDKVDRLSSREAVLSSEMKQFEQIPHIAREAFAADNTYCVDIVTRSKHAARYLLALRKAGKLAAALATAR